MAISVFERLGARSSAGHFHGTHVYSHRRTSVKDRLGAFPAQAVADSDGRRFHVSVLDRLGSDGVPVASMKKRTVFERLGPHAPTKKKNVFQRLGPHGVAASMKKPTVNNIESSPLEVEEGESTPESHAVAMELG